jgi:hypothetical protein
MPQADDASSLALTTRQDWMKARISALPKEAQKLLILMWPDDVPKLQNCTMEQIDKLIQAITTVEAEHSSPFFDPDPAMKKAIKRKLKAFEEVPS